MICCFKNVRCRDCGREMSVPANSKTWEWYCRSDSNREFYHGEVEEDLKITLRGAYQGSYIALHEQILQPKQVICHFCLNNDKKYIHVFSH